MDETTAVKRFKSSPPSTYIPLDIVQETILCRLPVKSLLRFRCVCKPWDSLVSKDLKFAKKHLRVSHKRQHLVTTTWREAQEFTVMSCPFDSLNLHSIFDSKSTQLDYSPIIPYFWDGLVASCDGILCFAIDNKDYIEQQNIHHDERVVVLYNPCIRKLQKLPYLDLPQVQGSTHYAFGYDPFIDNYKVVAVFCHDEYETQAKVHSYTLGTDSWKRIKDFPSIFQLDRYDMSNNHERFMRGTVNWLASSESNEWKYAIVSLHLGKEAYQEISLPVYDSEIQVDCL